METLKTPEEIIRKLAISQLSEETGIAYYFIQIDLHDEFVSRCIKLALEFRENPKKTIEERKNEFWHKCLDIYHGNVIDNLEWKLLNEFFEYWTEISPNAKKMRFEKEKVFDIKKRLERWKRNQKTFNNGNQQQSTYEKHEQGFDALFGSGSPFSVPES